MKLFSVFNPKNFDNSEFVARNYFHISIFFFVFLHFFAGDVTIDSVFTKT